jgi:hypothetical protein
MTRASFSVNLLNLRTKSVVFKTNWTELALLEQKKQTDKYMDRVLNTNDDLKAKFDQ